MDTSSRNSQGGVGVSMAMFGAVAVVMTRMIRKQESSSDELTSPSQHFFFDPEDEDMEQFVQSVPKIELHVHLDGSFDPYRLWDYLSKHPDLIHCFPIEKEMPWAKPGEHPLPLREMVGACENGLSYRQLCTCRRRYRKFRRQDSMPREKKPQGSLEDMLTCFEFFFPLVYNNETLLEELAFDFVQRQWEQNVIYTEVRYSPHLLSKDPTKSLAAITNGLRRGCQQFPVIVNQILCAICFFPDWASDILELARRHRGDFPCAVVGIDIAAGEGHFERDSPFWKGHYDMCQKAQELKLNVTIHAGETPDSADNVKVAVEEYGARRIGHAYRIADREDIMMLVRDKNVHVESCPTSSVETGGWQKTHWRNHPAVIFREFGIPVSLSSDDPAVFNTSLTWQYRIAMKKMGFQKKDVLDMLERAIEASFQDNVGKDELREKVAKWKIQDNHAFDDRVHFD